VTALVEAPQTAQTSADRRARASPCGWSAFNPSRMRAPFTLAAPDGSLLLPFVRAVHLVVECGERTNAYSLLDDGVVASQYRISVLLNPTATAARDGFTRRCAQQTPSRSPPAKRLCPGGCRTPPPADSCRNRCHPGLSHACAAVSCFVLHSQATRTLAIIRLRAV